MDNKNVFIAIALSMSVLLFWGAFVETPKQVDKNNSLNQIEEKERTSITPSIAETQVVKKVTRKKTQKNIEIKDPSSWITRDDNKLIALYKRNVPEIALSKMFKKSISQVRERIIYLMKK